MTELRGVGIGLGVAQGPIARMAEPLPARRTPERALGRGRDGARARGRRRVPASSRPAAPRPWRGSRRARGAGDDRRGPDPRGRGRQPSRERQDRRVRRPRRLRLVPRAAHRSGRVPRRARRRPRRRRPARHRAPPGRRGPRHPGSRTPLRARGEGPRPGRHRSARPRQGARPGDHRGRPDLAHGDPRPREVDRRGRRRGGCEGPRRRAVRHLDAAAGVVTVDPSADDLERAKNRADARAAAASAPITDGALADGTKVPLLANLGKPGGAAEAVELGAEGVGLFRTEFLFLSSTPRHRRGAARGVHRAAQRVPGQEGRRARARRRRRQAPPLPQRRARGEPGPGPSRLARPPRERGHSARAAHRPRRSGCRDPRFRGRTRRPVGHGAPWSRRSRRPGTSRLWPRTTD